MVTCAHYRKRSRGFTLIEPLVVITIILVLMGLIVGVGRVLG